MEARFDANDIMLRPTRSDGCVRRRAAEMALPAVKRWMGGDSWFNRDSDLIEDLMRHIAGSDGFEIVKSMDSGGWTGDDSLVEIMGADYISTALREMVRQWVVCLDVKLELPIGTKVRWRHYEGEIVKRDEERAQYGIRTPDMKDTSWMVADAEDVHALSGVIG